MNKLISTVVLGAALVFSGASTAAIDYDNVPDNKLLMVIDSDENISSQPFDELVRIFVRVCDVEYVYFDTEEQELCLDMYQVEADLIELGLL